LQDASIFVRRALQNAPEAHPLRYQLATMHYEQGDPHAAWTEVSLLPPTIRSTFDVQAFEALLLGRLGRHDAEIAIYERLLKDRPEIPELWKSYGDALKYAGRGGEAADALRKAVRTRPSYGEGWWSLANLKIAKFDDRDISTMQRQLRKKPDADDALHLNFALGKALEDRGRYAESFRHYDAGNRVRADSIPSEQMFVTRLVTESIATFDAELLSRVGNVGDPSNEPIFVIGLQRSGSTLIEQILASHSKIEGTSELMAMPQLWSEVVRSALSEGKSLREHLLTLPSEQFAELGSAYLNRARPFRSESKPRFVDKLPANWMHVGLIRLVVPNAKIVDARRHPMACGFSNFKQHYASGVSFAYSQESIGRFYLDYLRMMRHFDVVQPDAILHLLNEQLIDDKESEVRRLLDFIGVPFEQACLESHRTKRAVSTPSAEQVRRPINRDGMDYWRHFEPWLGPLKTALGPALVQWDKD
jgi:tetratricopeptide (TPR) repeat protein